MWWIDGHLDLAYLALTGRDLLERNQDLSSGCVSLPELREAGVRIVIGTVFTEVGAPESPVGYASHDDLDGAESAGLRQIEWYERMEDAGRLRIVRSRADLDTREDLLRIVILMEGADPIRASDTVRLWFDRGVRMVGLTWARGSRFAGGNAAPGPLTPAGRELVAALDAHGIVHDLSHLSDEAAEHVLSAARGRVIASHSNCRALMDPENQRHLSDGLLRAIAHRGGIIGLNLFSRFLATDRRATAEHCIRHLNHMRTVTGRSDCVALGSDADGGFPPTDLPEDLDHPSKWSALLDALESCGWSEDDRAAFAHGNWLRFLREALPDD